MPSSVAKIVTASALDRSEAMVDACIRIHALARAVGTPELIGLARLLVYQAGRQIADEIWAAGGGGIRPTEH